MRLLTSHSAVSIPLLGRIEVDPHVIKRLSAIDRLGNLTPRNVMVSPLFGQLATHLADHFSDTAAVPSELQWGLASQMRDVILTRQQLLVGLVPEQALTLMQEFFGTDITTQSQVTPVGQQHVDSTDDNQQSHYLLQSIGPALTQAEAWDDQDLPVVKLNLNDSVTHRHQPEERHTREQALVPVALNPSAWCQTWCRGTPWQQALVRQAFNGADSVSISSRNYAALKELDAGLIPSSRAYRALRSPTFWAYAVVFIYSSLRALPVTFVPHFRGSVLVLWSMDVLTAIPYTWGLLAFVTAHQWWLRYIGLFVTVVTFMAPYIYFWTHGRHYPWEVTLIVIAMIVGALAWETFNYLRDIAVKKGLRRKTQR